ncbi:hypothetical protein KSD_84780 [Ktedonobacter sp. SOSP1-85]|nr:hypothetical protein [Ktedonobacter sp. SOSP1-85]GHO80707.1 hypothetical protein KSD_84780 [Ktedonobacter sp. SOSP1-85]
MEAVLPYLLVIAFFIVLAILVVLFARSSLATSPSQPAKEEHPQEKEEFI